MIGAILALAVLAGQLSVPVVGRVLDSESGEPLAGVVVAADPADPSRQMTDAEGVFRLQALSDTVTIRLSRVGYAEGVEVVALDTAAMDAEGRRALVVRLDPQPIALEALRADAERAGEAERRLFDLEPMPGLIGISRHEIRDVPVMGEVDVLRALQALPGVVALNDLSAQLHVWGGAPDQNLFLLDGAKIFAPYHMFGLFGAYNTDAVERVEFYRGTMPARHGGALSATLETEQRSGAVPDEGIRAEGGAGLLGARLALLGALPGERGGWMFAARRTHADVAMAAMGRSFPYRFHDLHGRVDLELAEAHTVRVSAFGTSDHFKMFLHSMDDDIVSDWSNAAASARWTWRRADAALLSAEAWGSRYRASLILGGSEDSPETGNRIDASGLRLEYLRGAAARERAAGIDGWRESTLRLGLEVENARAAIDGSGKSGGYVVSDMEADRVSVAAYAEADARLGPIRLVPGLRLTEHPSRGERLLEPRIAARMEFGPDIAFTIGYAHAHQALSTVRDDRYVVPGAPIWFAHPAEWPVSRSAGATAELEGWIDARWQWRAAAYARRFHNVPRWRPVGERTIESMAFDDGRADGLELSVRRHGHRVSGWVSYGLNRARLTERETGAHYYAAWDRRHAADAAIFVRAWRELTLSARATFGTGMPYWPQSGRQGAWRFDPLQAQQTFPPKPDYPTWSRVQDRFPEYFRLDVGIRDRWTIGGLEIEPFVSVLNVTARHNVLLYTMDPNPYWGPNDPEIYWDPFMEPYLTPELQLPLLVFPSIGIDVRL